MKLRLTRPAAGQLDRVLASIAQFNPQGARNVQHRIHSVMHLLLQHPQDMPRSDLASAVS